MVSASVSTSSGVPTSVEQPRNRIESVSNPTSARNDILVYSCFRCLVFAGSAGSHDRGHERPQREPSRNPPAQHAHLLHDRLPVLHEVCTAEGAASRKARKNRRRRSHDEQALALIAGSDPTPTSERPRRRPLGVDRRAARPTDAAEKPPRSRVGTDTSATALGTLLRFRASETGRP